MFKSLDDRLKAANLEGNRRIAEKEKELVAARAVNAMLVAEIRERHEFAEKIRENWRVVKATVETFQCGDVKPRTFLLHLVCPPSETKSRAQLTK